MKSEQITIAVRTAPGRTIKSINEDGSDNVLKLPMDAVISVRVLEDRTSDSEGNCELLVEPVSFVPLKK
jgi:hypothetical protein